MEYREEVPLREQLQKWFGFQAFKGNQEAIIRNLLQGKDTFVPVSYTHLTLPTKA